MNLRTCIALTSLLTLSSMTYDALGCTLIKTTANGKTFVGNNEDFTNSDTRIWFEPGGPGRHGAAYVGYNNLFPEGGMNDAGLVFDAFGQSQKPLRDTAGKEPVFQLDLKRRIMQECETVDQVEKILSRTNLYYWSHSVWVFIDRSGAYLVVDGDSRIAGKDPDFIQTNFRWSEVKDSSQITCWRYKKARALLENPHQANVPFCTAVMDSVHQDITQYTTVYDLEQATIALYYYHSYDTCVTFNLRDELLRGPRVYMIPDLFPGRQTSAFRGIHRLVAAIDSLSFSDPVRDSARISQRSTELKKLPYLPHIIENRGYELLHLGRTAEAIATFRLFVRAYPEHPAPYDFLGEALMEDHQYEAAVASYKRSVELYPDNTDGWQRLEVLKKLVK